MRLLQVHAKDVDERGWKGEDQVQACCQLQRNWRIRRERHYVSKSDAFIYAYRPGGNDENTEFNHLSAYEFFTYWSIELVKFADCVDKLPDENDDDNCQARLTLKGVDKIKDTAGEGVSLKPGTDYLVKERCSALWEPLPDIPELQRLRHTWVLTRNRRPKCPKFMSCPMPIHNADKNERNAQFVFAYFHPFTLRRNVACTANPLPSSCKADHASWYASLEAWLDGSVLT